jgi:small-conductance mechanosensitive channel
MRVSWVTVLSVTVGAVLGVGVTVMSASLASEEPKGAVKRSRDEVERDAAKDARLAEMERNIASLRRSVSEPRAMPQPAAQPVSVAATQAVHEDPSVPRSPEEAKRASEEWVTQHEENLTQHRAQVRDLGWAPGMEASINESFDALPQDMKALVDDVECRSASCAVTLTWPSEVDARTEMADIARAVGALPCSMEIGLPSDVPTAGPVEVKLYMGCNRGTL